VNYGGKKMASRIDEYKDKVLKKIFRTYSLQNLTYITFIFTDNSKLSISLDCDNEGHKLKVIEE